jgi:FKBP-type peptidyl-prolyl cis-trans isomerase 2
MVKQEYTVKIRRFILIFITTVICLGGAIALSACGSASGVAKNGDTVQVNYTLTLADGTLVETTVGNQPIELTLGQGNFLQDFEKAIVGMKVGESKTISIPSANAYGAHQDDLVFSVNRTQLMAGVDPKIGDHLQTMDSTGQTVVVLVTAVTDATITIDANSPLAGKDLTFKIELLKIS